MKILLFGATGKCGRELLRQLPDEHQVRCFSRREGKIKGAGIEYFIGDLNSSEQLRTALQGIDAVVSFLGHKKGSPPDLQTAFMKRVIPLMKELGIKRLISLTGSGVPDPGNDKTSGMLHWMNEMSTKVIAFIDPNRVKDGEEHAKLIQNSDLDWTIVRTPLQLGARSNGTYWAGHVGKTRGWYAKREDIIHFVLKILSENSHLHQLPYLVS